MRRIAVILFLVVAMTATGARSSPIIGEIPFSRKTTLAVPGRFSFEFHLCTSADPADPEDQVVWSEQKRLRLGGRTLRHLLGSVKPFSNEGTGLPPVDFSRQLWVEVARMSGGSYEPLPGRTRLAPAPYALWSETAAALPPGGVTVEMLADGSVTDEKIAAGITRDGEVLPLVLAGDGAGSALDADLLDGQHGAYFLGLIAELRSQNALLRDEISSLRLGAGKWSAPFQPDTSMYDVDLPRVAMDAAGNAIAVWQQDDAGGLAHAWANRYTAGSGWGAPQPLDSSDLTSGTPNVAMDAAGNGTVVWARTADMVTLEIRARRWTAGSGWGAPQPLEAGLLGAPHVAMDAAGNGAVVWVRTVSGTREIRANRWTPGSGWGTAQTVTSFTAGGLMGEDDLQVAVDAAGDAMAVWVQTDGARKNIRASRYAPGAGWGTPLLVESNEIWDAADPRVAMDAAGNAVVVWKQDGEGGFSHLMANRQVPGAAWGTPEPIEFQAGNVLNPRMAMNAAGVAFVVWEWYDGVTSNIWSNCLRPDTGWGTAAALESDAGNAASPQVAMDSLGNAMAVWHQNMGDGNRIRANRFNSGLWWAGAETVYPGGLGSTGPQVALCPGGRAVVVWAQWNGSSHVINASILQ